MTNDINSRVWWWHLFLVLWIPVSLVYALYLPEIGMIGIVLGTSVVLAAVAALPGYYVESRRFRAAGSDWVPVWWLYALAHVLLTPFLAAPVYLVQRYRHVGR